MASKAKTNNVCRKLFMREIRGSLQQHRRTSHQRIFTRVPSSLCYRLRSLVSQDVLEEGHVFLGFTKCGRYVVSYSCQVMPDEHTGFPAYAYALQWWRFLPHSPLLKIREVKLFGEEDISQDVFISFCEWPDDHTKVLVFGHSLPGNDQDSCCECYITITAFPATQPCAECNKQQPEKKGPDSSKKCLLHGFSMHTKFELTPPFPPFAPRIQLKINSLAVINTGDSIIALHVAIGNNDQLSDNQILGMVETSSGCQSPEQAKNNDNSTCIGNGKSNSRTNCSSSFCNECGAKLTDANLSNWEKEIHDDSQKENVEASLHNKDCFKQRSPKPSQIDIYADFQGRSPKPLASPADRHSEYYQGRSPKPSSASDRNFEYQGRSPKPSCTERNFDFQGRSPKPSCDRTFDFQGWSPKPSCGDRLFDGHDTNRHTGSTSNSQDWFDTVGEASTSQGRGEIGRGWKTLQQHQQQNTDVKNVMSPKSDNTDIKCVMSPKSENANNVNGSTPRTSPRANGGDTRPVTDVCCSSCGTRTLVGNGTSQGSRGCAGVTGTPRSLSHSQRSFWSPSASSGTSRSTDSLYLQVSESRTVFYSVRNFAHVLNPGEDEPAMEDDLDLAYRSVLPVDVVTDDKTPLSLCPLVDSNQDALRITQMTFEVEHYLEEIIRHTAGWGHRYVAFTNYDLQILDVCPDENAVIGKVFVLIHAKEDADNLKKKRSRQSLRLYQTSFCFTWSLETGRFDTLSVDNLTEMDEMNVRRQAWKPGHKECSLLRRQTYIPQSLHRHVNVLSNESVFKGKSLSMIVSPHLSVAILM